MATPNQKLAASLTALRDLQKNGRRVFRSQELTRVHRERLLQNGFLLEVMKGWLISSSPGARAGDSTPWYASFWEFCARYCADRFGEDWHLSPEQSLLLHAEKTVIPTQVIIHSSRGTNHKVSLLFGTSLYDLKQPQMPPAVDIVERDLLRVFAAAAAAPAAPPIVGRIEAMWESMRGAVLDIFPPPPGLPRDTKAFLKFVDDIYRADAYHSLSIEGYSVSAALIERVRAGDWNPDHHDDDRQNRDALAARGYWQAFQVVKSNVGDIIGGANAGALVRTAHREWYRELFQPCVAAGLLAPGALAGYRNDAVYLRTSRYVPPRWEAVRDAMPALFDLLEHEPEPGARAVLAHWLFGYIHPYPDGNGRMARFLMNAMLASGGYPWTVVRVEDRNAYLAALDRASIDADIRPFAAFIAERVNWSLDQAQGQKH